MHSTLAVGESITTSAARGWLRISASSPKYSFSLYSFTRVPSFTAQAAPSSRMKNSFPTSPWVITFSFFLKVRAWRASAICPISKLSKDPKISTLFRKFSYLFLFLLAASFTRWEKVSRSMLHRMHLLAARMLAARGQLYSKASSPKTSPALSYWNTRFPSPVSLWENFLNTWSSPFSTMKSSLASVSPCWITMSPGFLSTWRKAPITAFISFSSKLLNINDFASAPLSRCSVSGGF
mmetsp:Transcript_46758/g.114652  ORF Transcript_46758/g.114652 Transcript_46758/m.114652 type:complete len:237 (+) Transcript_46758:191-901(+)